MSYKIKVYKYKANALLNIHDSYGKRIWLIQFSTTTNAPAALYYSTIPDTVALNTLVNKYNV